MLKVTGILETAQTFEVPLSQQLHCDSGVWHHIPESLQHLPLKAWLSSCTRSVKQKKRKRWTPICKKATSPAFNPTMLTVCIDIYTNDYLIHVVQFQKCRLQLLCNFLPNTSPFGISAALLAAHKRRVSDVFHQEKSPFRLLSHDCWTLHK